MLEKKKDAESYLGQISTRSLTSSNQYTVNSLAFTVNWLKLKLWPYSILTHS